MSAKLLSLALLAATAYSNPLIGRDTCGKDYQSCSPSGSTGTDTPLIGSDMSSMYIDLLNSVKGINFSKRSSGSSFADDTALLVERAGATMCCAKGTSCVNLQGLNIPMCYDKFTTNYVLPDGSYGTISSGDYHAKDGSTANLITGNFTLANGNTGDIYSSDEGAKPNTATLSIPPQYTGTGVGSAIPVTALASIVIYTSTIPGTTITAPTTLAASGTKSAQTITAPTTIAAQTTVVTSTAVGAAATSKGAAAGQVGVDRSVGVGMSLLSGLLYAIYAL